MRKSLNINQGWSFRYHDGTETALDLPHTWNALDGQDGGGSFLLSGIQQKPHEAGLKAKNNRGSVILSKAPSLSFRGATHPRVASLAPSGQFTFWESPGTR